MEIMITPELVAAVAASLAAVLSGLSLWLGGRREERLWRRDQIVDTLVQVLDSSFASPSDVLMRKRRAGTLSDEDHRLAAEAHAAGVSALTRLRVIAGASVVEAAEQLHMSDDTGSDMVLVLDQALADETWSRITEERRRFRDQLLDSSRRELGLGAAKPIHPGRAQQEASEIARV